MIKFLSVFTTIPTLYIPIVLELKTFISQLVQTLQV